MANTSSRRIWLILLVVVAILAVYFVSVNNKLVKEEENVKLTWANLQTTYQRRMDLVPSLVAIVKGSTDYEKQTLQQITEARSKAAQVSLTVGSATAENFAKQERAQTEVVNSTNRAIAVIENYPEIKSTKSFGELQSQLEGTERRIKVARNDFNGAVAQYNKLVRSFPSSIAASLFGYKTKEGFQSEAGAESAPEIKF
ncbi:MAG: LemA family protein [Bacteroidetes bacterium]|nr:MAG: LemA family protein [Bacteroidota bacterium]